jgi:hypothetical protein
VNPNHEHLDAETVAAWIDGGLDAATLAAAEAHASNCDRCQALLATVARTLPVDGIGDLKGAVSGTGQEERVSGWSWKWLTPIAATAAAVTLWMVVPQEPMRPPAAVAPQSDVAQAPIPSSPPLPSAPPIATTAPDKQVTPAERKEQFSGPGRDASGERPDARAKLADAQSNTTAAEESRERQEKRAASLERAAAAPPAASAPTVAAAPAEAARETAAPGAALGAVAQLRKQAAPIEIAAPDGRHRWRVGAETIEFSQDAGRTWMPVRLTAGDSVTAGVSPSALVCWLAGRQGLVLIATDGTNFTRLPFPERVDLSAITATDARQATVTTVDGRTFRTADSGRTWEEGKIW